MAKYKTYSDSSFIATGSPVVIDLEADIGSNAYEVSLFVGPGIIDVELSHDGTTYGDVLPIPPFKEVEFSSSKAKKVRLTHNEDSSYVILAFPPGEGIRISQIDQKARVVAPSSTSAALNSTISTTILAANPSRRGFFVSSPEPHKIWIKPQAASVDNLKTGIHIDDSTDDPFAWPSHIGSYTGEVSAISDSGNPVVHIVEF